MRHLILVTTLLSTLALTGCAGLNERMNARLQMELRERQAMLDAGYVPVPPTPHYHHGRHGGYDLGATEAFEEGFSAEDRLAIFRAEEAEFKRGVEEGKAGMHKNPGNFGTAKYLNGYAAGRGVYLDNARRAGGNARRSYE